MDNGQMGQPKGIGWCDCDFTYCTIYIYIYMSLETQLSGLLMCMQNASALKTTKQYAKDDYTIRCGDK